MKNASVSIVILAAGAGSRMKSQTPKVLHKICGKEMLFYSIDEALAISDDIHIVLFHHAEMIKERIMAHYPKQPLQFHIQDHQHYPGTGGALMRGNRQSNELFCEEQAKTFFSCRYEEILVLNGDMPLVRSHTLHKLCEIQAKIVMSVLHLSNPDGYGRVLIESGKVCKIVEQKDATNEELKICDVNAGVYKFHKSILEAYLPKLNNNNQQKEFYLTDVIALAYLDGVEVLTLEVEEEEFMGVNSKFELSQAQEVMLHRLRYQAMKEGVIMQLPHTIYIESGVRFSGECIIEQGVQILGQCEIIESHIKAHSVIESSIIDHSDVGPLAHIRPKSHLIHTHIGNFVETKSANLDGVKAGHLSYLGDCEIKKGSNIGAGVITCNYDGKSKHRTFIGENVFVGSDTQLVAPLCIESNVLIGAGSTITKNAAQGDLILSRVSQKNVPLGFYKFFPSQSDKES
ncbi:bifunctional UDP-N-acetylglucosamine diphosphorylase/glucosamine-1-phosphate N-acetyltransferase GlmU [Helicobacter sp. MIT 05-5293]|uniref:bifunctional UDP-N-acetylglucosamine diphosphorylase/glucosamine-1-phosphate N-acetyltransferase GlmU n=1 Tax=Helicobacter sp. MIT 05-5293 TaxID=1548149 RepID=UPI00051D23AC|nr:bifunctional UDP-N-acetylglucosamine diphosphorylase/glucosamine-1-phosphate N-acetyltransferase GlmU [Helicobacter sp. MIT 05-5293]TLD81015.1 bifunctional UDP-N-acetylglucosamine diphosphorylase/glucosamine-1-phosphate N-acetyltransferase GlmU [Helicobacter sp. MIT 05-5293]